MNSTGTYAKIRDNLTFLKSKESLAVIDDTINHVSKNNLSFIDGFLYFTEQQVEKKKINLINHSVKMAGFPKIKSLAPLVAELIVIISSGAEVPSATIVSPINISGI